MLDSLVNSELYFPLYEKIPSPEYTFYNKDSKSKLTPMLIALAQREEINNTNTKCLIISLENKQRIFEWFRGDVLGSYVFEFVRIQEPKYKEDPKKNFKLFIIQNGTENGEEFLPDKKIIEQIKGSRGFLEVRSPA